MVHFSVCKNSYLPSVKKLISPLWKTEFEVGTGIGAEKKYYFKSAFRTGLCGFFSPTLNVHDSALPCCRLHGIKEYVSGLASGLVTLVALSENTASESLHLTC